MKITSETNENQEKNFNLNLDIAEIKALIFALKDQTNRANTYYSLVENTETVSYRINSKNLIALQRAISTTLMSIK